MTRRAALAAGLMAALVTLVAVFVLPAPASAASGDGSFARKRIDVSEGMRAVRLDVTRSTTEALEPWRAWWSTEDRETDDLDYEHDGDYVELGVGQTTTAIVIELYDDLDDERAESFRVRLFDGNGSREIDHAFVTITDDDDPFSPDLDAESLETEGVDPAGTAAQATTAPRPGAPAAGVAGGGSASTGRTAVSNASRPAVRPSARATGQTSRGPRLTPFHLQGPSGDPASAPTEGPPSAVTAAGLLGALALARVSAELWFRLRVHSV